MIVVVCVFVVIFDLFWKCLCTCSDDGERRLWSISRYYTHKVNINFNLRTTILLCIIIYYIIYYYISYQFPPSNPPSRSFRQFILIIIGGTTNSWIYLLQTVFALYIFIISDNYRLYFIACILFL